MVGSARRFRITAWFLPAVLALQVLQMGCTVRTRDAIMYHAFTYPSPPRESGAAVRDTLMVYRFVLDSGVDTNGLVISQSDGDNRSVFLHRWQHDPADMIADLILRDMESSGLFQRAVDQWSGNRYRYSLEGVIRSLKGMIRDEKASAVVEVDATLVDFEAPMTDRRNVMTKSYRIEIPSKDTSPAEIVKALNVAVKDLSDRIRADIRFVLEKDAPEPAGTTKRRLDVPTLPLRPSG